MLKTSHFSGTIQWWQLAACPLCAKDDCCAQTPERRTDHKRPFWLKQWSRQGKTARNITISAHDLSPGHLSQSKYQTTAARGSVQGILDQLVQQTACSQDLRRRSANAH